MTTCRQWIVKMAVNWAWWEVLYRYQWSGLIGWTRWHALLSDVQMKCSHRASNIKPPGMDGSYNPPLCTSRRQAKNSSNSFQQRAGDCQRGSSIKRRRVHKASFVSRALFQSIVGKHRRPWEPCEKPITVERKQVFSVLPITGDHLFNQVCY